MLAPFATVHTGQDSEWGSCRNPVRGALHDTDRINQVSELSYAHDAQSDDLQR